MCFESSLGISFRSRSLDFSPFNSVMALEMDSIRCSKNVMLGIKKIGVFEISDYPKNWQWWTLHLFLETEAQSTHSLSLLSNRFLRTEEFEEEVSTF
jgi:hypothetical protein